MDFILKIANWYTVNKRKLPWRITSDPYFIWLSEIILQQTRVVQGLDYYNRFIQHFPEIYSLASADIDQVLKLWQGLGYYTRARNMHKTANIIVSEYHGKFPTEFEKLKKLPGIGDYTAAAISSISFNAPIAVVDGNVFRVIARYFGIKTPINTIPGKIEFQKLANSLIDKNNPGESNQAMMEFGAIQCTPGKPACNTCPLSKGCFAFINDKTGSLPVKVAKSKIETRYFNYLCIKGKDHIYVNKREKQDIWKLLYDFPLIETNGPVTSKNFMKNIKLINLLDLCDYNIESISEEYRHVLTHQKIFARFYNISAKKTCKNLDMSYEKVKLEDIYKLAVPKLIDNYVKGNIFIDFLNHNN